MLYLQGKSLFRREYNKFLILTHNSLFTSYLAAVGGVTVGEQEAAAGEQRAQAGAADHQDPAGARRPGRQEE